MGSAERLVPFLQGLGGPFHISEDRPTTTAAAARGVMGAVGSPCVSPSSVCACAAPLWLCVRQRSVRFLCVLVQLAALF